MWPVVSGSVPNRQRTHEIYKQAYEEEKIASGGTNQESGAFATESYADFIQGLARQPSQAKVRILVLAAGNSLRHFAPDRLEPKASEFAGGRAASALNTVVYHFCLT